MAITIEKIGGVKNKLGEGPVWDVADKALYWIDGSAPAIYRLDPKTNDIKSWKTPKPIGSFALRAKGGAVLALSDGFYLFDFASGDAKLVGDPVAQPGTTFNDGKTDARGRFIAGTLDSKFAQPIGSIFSLDASLKCTTLEPAIGCPVIADDSRLADQISGTPELFEWDCRPDYVGARWRGGENEGRQHYRVPPTRADSTSLIDMSAHQRWQESRAQRVQHIHV